MRHELHLTRKGLAALLLALVPLMAAGAALGGMRGVASVALGAGIVGANHLLATASTAWARTLGPAVAAVGYAGFVLRMGAVFATLAVAAGFPWVHRALLAAAFCAALVVTLSYECWSYARGSYVPRWRMEAGR